MISPYLRLTRMWPMETAPLFVDLGRPRPTLRQIADLVKTGGGADALTDAMRRADAARYQEVRCHSFDARRYQTQFELGSDDEFASIIFVKANFVETLRTELDKPSWKGDYVVVGAATDCYKPIEGHYKLTRGSLEALCARRNPTGVITKGPMIVRDKDVLQDLTARADCNVCISVPSVDEDAWRQLEPGTAHPMQRLRAVRELVDAGIHAGVLMNPIVPGITSKPALLERTVKAIADHGAEFVGCNVMFLEGGTRDHFMRWLQQEYPQLVDGYTQLYARKYAPRAYRNEVSSVIAAFKQKYGLVGQRFSEEEKKPEEQEGPAEMALPFESRIPDPESRL